MFLKDKTSGELVEVLTIQNLYDPFLDEVAGRYQRGEEVQDPVQVKKTELIFPSGEKLPRCWIDPHYRSADKKI